MSLPEIVVIGRSAFDIKSPGPDIDVETRELSCSFYPDDRDLERILVAKRPHVIATFGEEARFQNLMHAPYEVRKRWINFAADVDAEEIGRQIFYCFLDNATAFRRSRPLVSVFTPAYRSGSRILRPFRSLRSQTYVDWEWVIVDDSDDDGATFSELEALATQDHRIRVYRPHRPSGRIGDVKQTACRLAGGDLLLELDHDDELTSGSLEAVALAFHQHPEAGFLYTDWAEVFEDGRNATYGEHWAFFYGKDRTESYNGREYIVHEAPKINAKTIRHIVSAPNHIRAWRKDFYHEIGGHNPDLAAADDYELCVRTFLHTRMILLRKFCYIQYYNTVGNTQRLRNKDIQRLTRAVSEKYDARIHRRFVELGVDDFTWDAGRHATDWSRANPATEPHCSLLVG
ncbi:Glycosyl transferase family 2 [Methylobacterium sp. ap11]|uniref:glycosyltransferase n=1 Tax=Methylobacterium sp. ap11 TaxID=1761799 RepID=UPI0008B62312|nr:glycosyltransferase [Methylobacterium sp. ap11]SEO98290.1 Glycosyl transferase family 2 [Methylobacterium sp. ap11]